jgi:hypothetical protein
MLPAGDFLEGEAANSLKKERAGEFHLRQEKQQRLYSSRVIPAATSRAEFHLSFSS